MTSSELEIRAESEIRLREFEERTGLPARASLEDLELMGGRYMSSRPIEVGGQTKITEYIILDLTGARKDVAIYKRSAGEEDFRVHLEVETKNLY